jgi:hypothetical protein
MTDSVTSNQRVAFENWLLGVQGLTATWNDARNCYNEFQAHIAFKAWQEASRVATPPPAAQWQPIETAPRDGTVIDLWIDDNRWSDCRWGLPGHSCGEDGHYCDSEWHSLDEGWVCISLNQELSMSPTHWMPLPPEPGAAHETNDRRQEEVLMLRSVGAMAIAEGDEGWGLVPIDCPMLVAVKALRERYNWLAQVLYCDHGDNQRPGQIGWGIRFNLRDGHQFMYGPSIDMAIDAGRAAESENEHLQEKR